MYDEQSIADATSQLRKYKFPRKGDFIDEALDETYEEEFGSTPEELLLTYLQQELGEEVEEVKRRFQAGDLSPQEFEQLLGDSDFSGEDYQAFLDAIYFRIRKLAVISTVSFVVLLIGLLLGGIAAIQYFRGEMVPAMVFGVPALSSLVYYGGYRLWLAFQ